MKIFKAMLETKGYLHFYSTEYLKTTRVSDVLHNWALMFAVNDIRSDPELDHIQNLRSVNFYCTAALPLVSERRIYKRNPVPEDTAAGKMGLMEIEYYLPGSTFEFYILSRDGSEPPSLVPYGKKRAPVIVTPGQRASSWGSSELSFRSQEHIQVRPNHMVNPIDYDEISSVDYLKKIPMKPSPLYYASGNFSKVLVVERLKVVVPNIEEIAQWN